MTDTDDAEWMRRLAAGELSALGPLYERYRTMVLSLIRQVDMTLASSTAEDCCQEVFLALVDAAGRFKPGGSVRAYLAGIALRKAKEHRRNTWFGRTVLAKFAFGPKPAPSQVDEQVGARLEGGRLLAALAPAFREVLVLHVVEGMGAEEISAALNISVSTVWTRLHRARQKLAELTTEAPP